MAVVYILHSPKIDKYYTRICKDFGERLHKHKSKKYAKVSKYFNREYDN